MPTLTIPQTLALAIQHHQAGRLVEAENLYQQILAQQTDHPETLRNLGLLASQTGRRDAALDLWRRAAILNSGNAPLLSNLADLFGAAGQSDEAIAAFRQAVAVRPDDVETLNKLGAILGKRGEFDEAIALFRWAIAIKPDFAEAYLNLGIGLRNKGRLDEALAACRQAIASKPDYAEAHFQIGNLLVFCGQIDEGIAAFRQSISLKPDYESAHSALLFTMHNRPACGAQAIAAELSRWNRQHAEPLGKSIVAHANDRDRNRPLRIGYVSSDFRDHVVGRNLLPLFAHHDRRRFNITCYANVVRTDAMTADFRKRSDRWRNIVGLSDEQAAQQIREDGIDILVDLALHTAGNRLLVFARKPAPVQATFAGYPGSTGLSAIDYRLSDPYLDPPDRDESIYSERTIRLPSSFWCYDPLDCGDISVGALPALQTAGITFGCLCAFFKINDAVLALWAEVLRQMEKSRLLLLASASKYRQRTIERLGEFGIDAARIEFVLNSSRRAYLEKYRMIDIGLDTFPYNGHTTSLDSFWMGVPVVTLVGETAVSRAGWCQLSNLELTELAAETPEQFVRIAVELAKDLPRLAELRRTLRTRMERSPLMDAPKFTRDIEAAYRQMWQTWCDR